MGLGSSKAAHWSKLVAEMLYLGCTVFFFFQHFVPILKFFLKLLPFGHTEPAF